MQAIPDVTVPAPMPAALQSEVNDLLSQLESKLEPYVRSLTVEQRHGLAKMGPDSVDFVQNGQNAVDFSMDYMARDFDEITFKNAFALTNQLTPIAQRLDSLARGADDADMLFGSIAYSDALEIYNALGSASKKDSGLVAFYDAMKVRFAKLRGKRTPTP